MRANEIWGRFLFGVGGWVSRCWAVTAAIEMMIIVIAIAAKSLVLNLFFLGLEVMIFPVERIYDVTI